MRQPTRELGRLAVSRLAARLGGDAGADQRHQLASALVLRVLLRVPTTRGQHSAEERSVRVRRR